MANWKQYDYDPSLHNFHKGVIENAPNEGYPKNYFFADTLRSLVIGFGNFFNDLYVIRYNESGEPIKQIQVPLKYGPRMKSHDFRVEQETGKKYTIPLPNMYYRITSVNFAADRYAGGGEVRGFYSNYFEKSGIDYKMTEKFWADVQPVPVNVVITMDAKTEHISDANHILESIITRFAPDAWFDLKEFWFVNLRRAIKMKCESSNIDMNPDFGEDEKREIGVSFTFTLEAFLYKPIQDTKIIDQIITHCGTPTDEETFDQSLLGNYSKDNPFKDRYDFAYQFGTKIGRVSALKDDYPLYKVDNGTSVVEYDYIEKEDITNYPAGSKLIRSVSAIPDSTSSTWMNVDQTLQAYGSSPSIFKTTGVDTKSTYWTVTGDENVYKNGVLNLDSTLSATSAQNTIWEFSYNPGYVINPGKMKKVIEDGTYKYITEIPAQYGGFVVKKYDNLFGFGKWSDDESPYLGTKDIQIGMDYVSGAPIVGSIKVQNKS